MGCDSVLCVGCYPYSECCVLDVTRIVSVVYNAGEIPHTYLGISLYVLL